MRSLAPVRLKLKYEKPEELESIRRATEALEERGFSFVKMVMSSGDLRSHDMLYFKHPKLGTVEVVSYFVNNWSE
ncbi:MAG: hypothetical protein ACLFPR_14025, partial [Desulfococcaceae bacterium]